MKHFRPEIYPLYIHWDLNACPPPKGKKGHLIVRTIWSAARSRSLFGEPHIQIYYTKNTLDESTISQLGEFYDSRCIINCAEDEFKKVNFMLLGMHVHALCNRFRPTNCLVITKIQQDTEYLIRGILSLEERGGREAFYFILPDASVPTGLTGIMTFRDRVYLKLIDSASDTCEIKAWRCNLLEKILDEDEDLDDQMSHLNIAEEEQDDESMEVAVQGPLWRPTSFSSLSLAERNTSVLWDVEDYPLPPNLSLYAFYKNIKDYMKGEAASNGDVIIWSYVPDYMMEAYKTLADEFRSYEFEGVVAERFIFVPKVQRDKYARLHQMILDLLLWGIDNLRRTQKGIIPNLLVIAKNIEPETSFLPVLGGLGLRGHKVFLTLPPPADDVAPKDVTYVTVLPWEDLLHRSWPTGMPSKRRKSLG